MSSITVMGLIYATFAGVDASSSPTDVAISVPGLKSGDIILQISPGGVGSSFEDNQNVISVDDEIQQGAGLNRSGWNFKAVLFRPPS